MRKEDFLKFVPEKYKAGNMPENIAAKATIKAVLDSIGLDFTIRTKGDQITITAVNPTPADSDILEKIDSAICDYCFDYSGDFYDPKKPASEVLETLKRNGFKWFRTFGYWGTFKNGRTADQMRTAIGL